MIRNDIIVQKGVICVASAATLVTFYWSVV